MRRTVWAKFIHLATAPQPPQLLLVYTATAAPPDLIRYIANSADVRPQSTQTNTRARLIILNYRECRFDTEPTCLVNK